VRLSRLALTVALGLAVSGCGQIAARRLFAKAQALEAKGKYREAASVYERVGAEYSRYPEAIDALSRAGSIYGEKLCEWTKAVAVLRNLTIITEGTPSSSRALLQLGSAGEHAGPPFLDSIRAYEAVRNKFPGTVDGARAGAGLGRVKELLGAWAEARAAYRAAINSPLPEQEKQEIWRRLQGVWLWDALGTYFSGRVDEGVALAKEGLELNPSVSEVRRGLEEVLTRYAAARRLWRSPAGYVVADGVTLVGATDASRFFVQSRRGIVDAAPEAWSFEADLTKGSFVLKENPFPEASGGGAIPAAKPKSAKTKNRNPWIYRSSSQERVLGVSWSSDGNMLGWIGREKTGATRRRVRVLDLRTRKSWAVYSDASGKSLGEVMLFMPRGEKVVFPYGNYLVVSDLKGGNMIQMKIRDDELGSRDKSYSGPDVEMLACSADGLELFVSVPGAEKKANLSGKKENDAAKARVVRTWKVNLSTTE